MFAALALILVPATSEAPLDFTCVAPLGHIAQVRQVLAGPTYRVTGEFHPVRLEEIPDPALPVRIQGNNIPIHVRSAEVILDSEAEVGRYVELVIMPRYRGSGGEGVADVFVQFRREPEAEDESRAITTIPTRGVLWEHLSFDIEAHVDRVVIEAGGHRTEVPVTLGPGASVNLTCTGGDFSFRDMTWGDLSAGGSGR